MLYQLSYTRGADGRSGGQLDGLPNDPVSSFPSATACSLLLFGPSACPTVRPSVRPPWWG
jgi:hypothetical protein